VGRIPDEIIQQIRDRVDLVELVGRTVSLKRAGRSYKGLCPFHGEKTPSFNVNPDRGSYYCFGCQEGGDAFSFLMKVENLTFAEAARSLARDCGIEIPETRGAEGGVSEAAFAANEIAQATYRAAFAEPGNPAAAYLAERCLSGEDADRFEVGFAPDQDQEPKYLNTPESPIFHKREAFYGLSSALAAIRRADRAVVVEGYFDRIALARAGVEEALATCGTALSEGHARNLRRRTRNVVLLFDGDEAGQRAMERSLEVLLPAGLRVRAALLPPGTDPDDLLVREGAEALRAVVDRAPDALDFAIDRAIARGCATPAEQADAVAAVAPLLALIPSGVERSGFAQRLALAVGTEVRHVEAAVRAASRGEDARDAVPIPVQSATQDRKIRQLARSLVDHPDLARRVSRDDVHELVPAGPLRELIAALLDAAAEDRSVPLEELAGRLGADEARLLRQLAATEEETPASAAARTIDDTIRWLRKERLTERLRALTQRLRDPNADVQAILEEKDRLTKQRLAATHHP
jgi:DNA primase